MNVVQDSLNTTVTVKAGSQQTDALQEWTTADGKRLAWITDDGDGFGILHVSDNGGECGISHSNLATFDTDGKYGDFTINAAALTIKDPTPTTGTTLVDVQLGAAQTAKSVVLKTNGRVQMPLTTPSSSSESGEPGTIAVDGDYIYVCNASGVWKRSALSSF